MRTWDPRAPAARSLTGALLVCGLWQLAAACGDSSNSPVPPIATGGIAGTTTVDAGTPPPPPASDAGAPTSPGGAGGGGSLGSEAGPVGVCLPGETRACGVDLLCTGVETCRGDGQGFGPCECAGAVMASAIVGAKCNSDADCHGGAFCLTADGTGYLGQGGPAGGYCTFNCTDTASCTQLDPNSICGPVGPNDSRLCVRSCLSKTADEGEGKCLNRTDLVCTVIQGSFSANRQEGACLPRCGADEDCPKGRFCHRQGGICADFISPGEPVGSACGVDTDCDGRACEDEVEGVGTCTASCVLGALSGCGYGRNPSSREAGCVVPQFAASGFSEGPGDLGYCLELCDVDADCDRLSEGFVCRTLNAGLAAFFGRAGACGRGSPAD